MNPSQDLTSPPPKVLVASGDPTRSSSMKRALEEAGMSVEAVGTLRALTDLLETDSVFLVILDSELPDGDAASYCSRQRKGSASANSVFIVLLEEGASSDMAADVLDAGADGCFYRPLGDRELVARIKKVMRVMGLHFEREQLKERESDLQSRLDETAGILQAAMDSSSAGIAIADAPDGKLRYVNRAGLLIRGEPEEKIVHDVDIGKYAESWQIHDFDGSLLEPDDIPLARAIKYGETCTREFVIRRDELDDVIIRASAAPVKNDTGAVIAGVVVFIDITEAKQAEQELEKSVQRINHASKLTGTGFWEWNPLTNEIYWSKGMFSIFGYQYTAKKVDIDLLRRRIHPEDADAWHKDVSACLEGKKKHNLEYRLLLPDGTIRWVAAYGDSIRDDFGNTKKMTGVLRDVTEEKRISRDLEISKHRNKLARQFSGVGMWEWSPNTGKTYWSEEIYGIFECPAEEEPPTVEKVQSMLHPNDRESFKKNLSMCLEEGASYENDFRLVMPDGRIKWLAARGNALRDDEGRVTLLIGVMFDISKRIQKQQQLTRLTEVLGSIRNINKLIAYENNPQLLMEKAVKVLVDKQGFDEAACVLLDAHGNGKNCFVDGLHGQDPCNSPLIGPNNLTACMAENCDSTETCIPSPGQCRVIIDEDANAHRFCGLLHHGGTDYGVLCVATSIDSIQIEEEQDLFMEICEDLGYALHNIELGKQQDESFKQLEVAKEQAELANQAKDEFLAVMNHELRTPLNPIMGFTQLMMEQADEMNQPMLESILDSAERMLSLIDLILEFSSLDKSKVSSKKSAFDLTKSCKTVFEEIRPQADNLDYQFENGGSGLRSLSSDLQVLSDRNMVIRILENLLQNACKYTKTGSVKLTIGQVVDGEQSGMYRFIVSDTGIGMDEAIVDSLFEAFAQADSSYTRSYSGLGLGLAICNKLVDLLGGKIRVSSELGQGSIFTVDLPLETVKESTAIHNAPDTLKKLPHFRQSYQILVVDDEFGNAELGSILIKSMGGQPVIAHSGQEAVKICGEQTFDLILMDLHMPEMDGFEALSRIREEAATNQTTPVVALTANVSDSAKQKCQEHGMCGFIEKPIRLDALAASIESAVKPIPTAAN